MLDGDGERTVPEHTAQELALRTGWSTVLTATHGYAAVLAVGLRVQLSICLAWDHMYWPKVLLCLADFNIRMGYKELQHQFGFTPESIVASAKE